MSDSSTRNSLKDYRGKEMKQFVAATIIMILFLSGEFSITVNEVWELYNFVTQLIKNSFIASAFYMYVLLADSLYSPKIKMYLVYWWKDMPGFTSFTDLVSDNDHDPRISVEEAKRKYRHIICKSKGLSGKTRKRYENECWYKIYSQRKEDGAVNGANRTYLAYRDMAVATVNIFIFYVLLVFILKIICSYLVILWLSFLYLLTTFAARNKSKRLVSNVFACDLAGYNSEQESNRNS